MSRAHYIDNPKNGGLSSVRKLITLNAFGVWRSLVAHHAGGVGAAGSNPATPTRIFLGCHEDGRSRSMATVIPSPPAIQRAAMRHDAPLASH